MASDQLHVYEGFGITIAATAPATNHLFFSCSICLSLPSCSEIDDLVPINSRCSPARSEEKAVVTRNLDLFHLRRVFSKGCPGQTQRGPL